MRRTILAVILVVAIVLLVAELVWTSRPLTATHSISFLASWH